jgi:thioredoxin reductase
MAKLVLNIMGLSIEDKIKQSEVEKVDKTPTKSRIRLNNRSSSRSRSRIISIGNKAKKGNKRSLTKILTSKDVLVSSLDLNKSIK